MAKKVVVEATNTFEENVPVGTVIEETVIPQPKGIVETEDMPEIPIDAPVLTCECGATNFMITPVYQLFLVGDEVIVKQVEERAHCLGDHREYNLLDPASVERLTPRGRK